MRTILSDGLRFLEHVAPTASPHAALRATVEYLAIRYQQERASFLTRYQVVMQIPAIASFYLYALMGTEPAICDALCSHLEAATNRNKIRFLVAIYMVALRVALEEWLEQDAPGDLVSLLHGYLDDFSSLPHHA